MLERAGIATGMDLERLVAASNWLQGVMGRPLPAMVSRAPAFPERAA
jgi:hydroxymethylglutaryl-CoA lyase